MLDELIRVPRGTERVAWNHEALEAIPNDGKWHELKRCGRTTAYQTARQLNLGLELTPTPLYEFGARPVDDNTSALLVRRLNA